MTLWFNICLPWFWRYTQQHINLLVVNKLMAKIFDPACCGAVVNILLEYGKTHMVTSRDLQKKKPPNQLSVQQNFEGRKTVLYKKTKWTFQTAAEFFSMNPKNTIEIQKKKTTALCLWMYFNIPPFPQPLFFDPTTAFRWIPGWILDVFFFFRRWNFYQKILFWTNWYCWWLKSCTSW